MKTTPWIQDTDWAYLRRLEDVKKLYWTSFARSIYIVYPGVMKKTYLKNLNGNSINIFLKLLKNILMFKTPTQFALEVQGTVLLLWQIDDVLDHLNLSFRCSSTKMKKRVEQLYGTEICRYDIYPCWLTISFSVQYV